MCCRVYPNRGIGERSGLSRRDTFRIRALLAFACFGCAVSGQAADIPTASPSELRQPAELRLLRGGWYPWDPYQYRENGRGNETLTGFDVEIERAVARVMGVELLFSVFLQWEAERLQPQEIFAGVVVTIVGAFLTRMWAIAFRLKGWAYGW